MEATMYASILYIKPIWSLLYNDILSAPWLHLQCRKSHLLGFLFAKYILLQLSINICFQNLLKSYNSIEKPLTVSVRDR